MRTIWLALLACPAMAAAGTLANGEPDKATYTVMVIVMFAAIWAFGSKSGPFHDWAEHHTALSILAIFGLPVIAGFIVG